MTADELVERLKGIGLPVAKNAFAGTIDEPVPELPYIVYIQPHARYRGSDTKMLLKEEDLDIELYTAADDEAAETLRKAIESAVLMDTESEKYIAFVDDEDCFQSAYEIRGLLNKTKGA